jgi:hypothetical protein
MRKLPVLLLLCILLSCHGNNSVHVPEGIIEPDSMVTLLTDIHIFQANLQLGYFQNDSANASHKAFLDILEKHNLSQEDYNESIRFYTFHPVLLDSVYEKVLNNLNQQKAELMGKKHS